MKNRLQISTRKMSLSEVALETIRNKAKKLEQFYDRIIACKVMVERPHRHKNHGVEFNVSIDIAVPGGDIKVKHEHNEDVYVAIRDAFDSARRQLQNLNQRQKGKKQKVLTALAHEIAEAETESILDNASDDWQSEVYA